MGACTDDETQSDCEGDGRRYGGDGSDCATIDPPCIPPSATDIPTVSEWGLIVMTLIGLTLGTVLFRRSRRVAQAS